MTSLATSKVASAIRLATHQNARTFVPVRFPFVGIHEATAIGDMWYQDYDKFKVVSNALKELLGGLGGAYAIIGSKTNGRFHPWMTGTLRKLAAMDAEQAARFGNADPPMLEPIELQLH